MEIENQEQLANPGLPGKWPLKMVCVCVCVCACVCLILCAAGAWFAFCCWLIVSSNVTVELVGTRWRVGIVLSHTHDPVYKDIINQ